MTMTESQIDDRTTMAPEQRFGAVTRAEARRLLRTGGVPIPGIVAITAALASGILTMLIMKSLASEPTRVITTTSVESRVRLLQCAGPLCGRRLRGWAGPHWAAGPGAVTDTETGTALHGHRALSWAPP